MIELGSAQIFKMVQYFIKYHGINNYCGKLLILLLCFYWFCIPLQVVFPEMHYEIRHVSVYC